MFATPYDRKTLKNPKTICKEPTLTEQSHAAECDINNILMKHNAGDLLAHVKHTQLQFGDFTAVNEYDEALNTIAKAREAFEAVPARIRERIGNDPGAFIELVTDPRRQDELVELGLAKAMASETPTIVSPELEKAVTEMVTKAAETVTTEPTEG